MPEQTPERTPRAQHALNAVFDLVTDFVAYARREDEVLSPEDLAEAVRSGEVTVDELAAEFAARLRAELLGDEPG